MADSLTDIGGRAMIGPTSESITNQSNQGKGALRMISTISIVVAILFLVAIIVLVVLLANNSSDRIFPIAIMGSAQLFAGFLAMSVTASQLFGSDKCDIKWYYLFAFLLSAVVFFAAIFIINEFDGSLSIAIWVGFVFTVIPMFCVVMIVFSKSFKDSMLIQNV